MSNPIGAFRIQTLEGGLQVFIEAINVKTFKELPVSGSDSRACRINLTDGTWEDSGEPVDVVVRRYNSLVQAARMRKFSEDEGNSFGLHLNQDCLP